MEKVKIAFFSTKDYDKERFNRYNKDFNYDIHYFNVPLNSETAPLAKGFDAVCVFVNDTVDKETIEILKDGGIKLIALRCAGFNNVDLSNVGEIKVVRVPKYSPNAVAEHAVALLLCLNRKLYKAIPRTRKYNFDLTGLEGVDINGKTIGVIGTGKIGQVFARIMKGFGTRVLAYDVYPNNEAAKNIGYEYVDLDTLLHESDVISIHCPLTSDNEYLINKDTISEMKDGVLIVNTSRGKLIKTSDIIEGLQSGKIGGVALDVYEDEKNFFLKNMSDSVERDKELSLLLSMPHTIVTSHQAYFTKEALDSLAETTLQNVYDEFSKGTCENEVKE